MWLNFSFHVLLMAVLLMPALALPQPVTDVQLVEARDVEAHGGFFPDITDLWKRKGGGGGGGKGGGGSSSGGSHGGGSSSSGSSSSGSSSSGSSSSGSSSSGSSSSGSSSSGKGSTSSSSAAGGRTKSGSGVRPAFGGGRYYGGGATVPYGAGARSPLGITPFILPLVALSIFPGLWLYGAYAYPYNHPYTFHNATARANDTNTTSSLVETRDDADTGVNQTKPVTCLCAEYQECGCDDTGDTTFLDSLIGNGSYAALNHTLVTVADVNGTSTILLNGTLPNGTTAAGGTSAAAGSTRALVETAGYWVMVALVGCTVFFVQ